MKVMLRTGMLTILLVVVYVAGICQSAGIQWTKDGNGYYAQENGDIVMYSLPGNNKTVLVPKAKLVSGGGTSPISIRSYRFSDDENKVLIYTNSKKVWRYQTRGDYWLLNRQSGALRQLGKNRPASSLMFAKFSPDGNKVAYVSE